MARWDNGRQIYQVRQSGYVSTVDGYCYVHRFNPDGTLKKVSRANCGPWHSYAMGGEDYQLGEFAHPMPSNGFQILKGVGECPEVPDKTLVSPINGPWEYWYDPITGDMTMADSITAADCSEVDIDFQIPGQDGPVSKGGIFLSELFDQDNNGIDIKNLIGVGTMSILAVALIYIWIS